ncbi:hypothetical protein BN903_63 [Halorubrum sp. AJ67]|nr:hypothetical protein BN903_63 [Halorubrum sp. AJ67]
MADEWRGGAGRLTPIRSACGFLHKNSLLSFSEKAFQEKPQDLETVSRAPTPCET